MEHAQLLGIYALAMGLMLGTVLGFAIGVVYARS